MQSKASRFNQRLALAILTAIPVIGVASFAGAGNSWAAPMPQENDITRGELANFDRFLDSHPNIAQDLKANPGLVNDASYLSQHPELQQFLNSHPGVREELKENPRFFMNRERRFERRGGDINRTELRNFDQFLDSHPNIAQDLKANPGLVNDPNYLSQHPELQQFLNNHPGVREELKENPRLFLNRERRFERSGGDITRGELRSFDGFLDKHPEIDEQLRKNPQLINDPQFVSQHPELQEYLKNHPRVTEELKEHPKFFMHRERKFERHERGENHRKRHG